MTSPTDIPRDKRLKAWMVERDITNVALAKELGISHQRVAIIIKQDTMPRQLHTECIRLGFPNDLLPTPVDWKGGRKPRPKPYFPGLAAEA